MQLLGAISLIARESNSTANHDDTAGWIVTATWLTFAGCRIRAALQTLGPNGPIAPGWTDSSFTGCTTTITGVLTVLGVALDLGSNQSAVLTPA